MKSQAKPPTGSKNQKKDSKQDNKKVQKQNEETQAIDQNQENDNEQNTIIDYDKIQLSLGQRIRKSAIKWAPAMRMTILLCIGIMAILVRVFSVIRYESVIHEFDPWFNYRTTKYILENGEGLYGLWNWFDPDSWYPLGRAVGGTVYPGLMSTAYIAWYLLHNVFCLPIDIRNVCVFMGPVFSAFTAFTGYFLTKEITKRSEAGLFACLFIAIVPTYMSRSVAGSYDNEAVSIWALVHCFYTWVKAANTGSIWWGAQAGLALFYMVSTWGGYAFVINTIPIFVLFLLVTKRYSTKVYVGYNVFYIIGTFLSMQIPFVGFQAMDSSEHLGSHGVFILINLIRLFQFLRQYIDKKTFKKVITNLLIIAALLFALGFTYLILSGKSKWSGRSLTLLDPTYAKKYIPIIASVSEHQPTTWSSFFFDLHFLMIFTPIGLWYLFKNPNQGKIFLGIYVVLATYFASVMVRLLLVLGPAAAMCGGIGVSAIFRNFTKSVRYSLIGYDIEKIKLKGKKNINKSRVPAELALFGCVLLGYFVSTFILHAHFSGAEAYSSPSIILSSKDRNGNRHIIDDFRESYYWLRMNTKPDAKVLAWWDYGYQLTGMSNRTVIADNNTWNNTHIATIGLAMAENEKEAYEICDKLDANYVLMIFGGASYYSGDDINKFLWIIRIASGVYPHIKEENYYSQGKYKVDKDASPLLTQSLMYKLSYYRFGDMPTAYGKNPGFDTVRNVEIGDKNIKLDYFKEAFTSENWIVRIYSRNERQNREAIPVKQNYKSFPQSTDQFKDSNEIFDEYQNKKKFIIKKKRKVAEYKN